MPVIGYIALLQLADLQWMYYWQNIGCIFGEITAIAGEYKSSSSKNKSNNFLSVTDKTANPTSTPRDGEEGL